MKRAYRYRLYPSPAQETLLRKTIGCARFVYNRALEARNKAWFQEQKRLSYGDLSKGLTLLKRDPDHAWLREVSSVALQQALCHLQTAYVNFWENRAAPPSFKKRRSGGSASFVGTAVRYAEDPDRPGTGSLKLPKMKSPLKIRWSRSMSPGANPSTVTVSVDPAGRWHVSLLTEEESAPLPPTEGQVGIDLGLSHLLVTSDGYKVANPRHLARDRARLVHAQRILSRRLQARKRTPQPDKRIWKNIEKARRRVARIHARIADRRRDGLHKLTTALIRENQTICVETLAVKNMIRNRRLSRAISDVGWSELVRQLEYKAEWYGRELVKISRWYPSSKTCSGCGHLLRELPLGVRTWTCPACGAEHDRDVNAAKNILAAGLAVAACGEGVRRGRSSGLSATLYEAGNTHG